jgi:hypothetical protein
LLRTIVTRLLVIFLCAPLWAQQQQIDETKVKNLVSDLAAKASIVKVQQEGYIYAADTGAANAYAITLSPAPTITAGSVITFQAAHANTTASTVTVNGTSYPLTKNGASALVGGEIAANQVVTAKSDGTNFQLSMGLTGATGATGTTGATGATGPAGPPGGGGGGNYVNLSGSCSVTGATLTSGAFVVTGSPVSSITISSIPGSYLNLIITFDGQTSNGSIEDGLIQLNGDTGTNYEWSYQIGGVSGTMNTGGSTGQSSIHFVGLVPSSLTSKSTSAKLEIFNYTGSTFFKNVRSDLTYWSSGSGVSIGTLSGTWNNATAVTSFKLTTAGGHNFPVGTTITIYGTN